MRLYLKLLPFFMLPVYSFGQAPSLPNPGDPVAIVAGQPISEAELQDAIGVQQWMQLRNQEYEIKNKALENLIRLRVVQAEAKKRGVSPEKLIEEEVDSKVAEPSDAEVEAFFWGQNRAGSRLDDVKNQLRSNLKQLKTQKARQQYADRLRETNDVSILLRPPSVDVPYDVARVEGNPKAEVTIVEFADFQCPFCKKSESTLKGVLAKYDGRVKLAFLDFPLSEIHGDAEKAAEAARCAGEQGKYWEYHDSLFADTSKLDEAGLAAQAQTVKLDEASFKSCIASGKFKAKVEADRQEGAKLGVSGTPSYFINGVFLSGAQSEQEFERIIDTQLAASGRADHAR